MPRNLPAARILEGPWIAPITGLIAALSITLFNLVHPPRWLTWAEVILYSLKFVVSAFLVCAVSVVLSLVLHPGRARILPRRDILQASAIGVWFVPLILFAFQGSPWVMPAALVVGAGIANIVLQYAERAPEAAWPEFTVVGGEISVPNSRRIARLFIAAILLEAGAIAAGIDQAAIALLLHCAAAAIITMSIPALSRPHQNSNDTRFLYGRVALVAVAFVLTVFALSRYLQRQYGSGDGEATAQAMGSRARSAPPAADPTNGDFGQDMPGVILWPEEQEHTMLVPPLPSFEQGSGLLKHDVSIPFYGEYWFYRRPNRRPPATSSLVRGDPTKKAFISSDHVPLTMEAHQNLGVFIDLDCCRRIDVGIRNDDGYIGTVSLELIVTDTSLKDRPSESLGKETVTSTPHWSSGIREARTEVLSFPVPAHPKIRRFDEVTVLFHLGWMRRDTSARIAIDKFSLVR